MIEEETYWRNCNKSNDDKILLIFWIIASYFPCFLLFPLFQSKDSLSNSQIENEFAAKINH